MATEGFAQIRNGLKEHIEAGKLCPTDLGVYTFLHLYCDYSTGIYKGTALGIAYRFGDASYKGMVNKSLARLKKIKFINYREGNGKRGGYQILIDKFEPTFGELRGRHLNAWEKDVKGNPVYDAVTVAEQSWHGEGTVEERLRKSQGRVGERVPYIQTLQTDRQENIHTSPNSPGDDAATLPSLPPESETGKSLPVEPVPLAPLVPLDDNPPVTPTPHAANPPQVELADIRDWPENEERHGISGARIRYCIRQQLDVLKSPWYCGKAYPTVGKINSKSGVYVTKLNEDTEAADSANKKTSEESKLAPGWSGQTYKANEVRFE